MKATIQADGTLFITAETELESYALRMWSRENNDAEKAGSHLVFSTRLPDESSEVE